MEAPRRRQRHRRKHRRRRRRRRRLLRVRAVAVAGSLTTTREATRWEAGEAACLEEGRRRQRRRRRRRQHPRPRQNQIQSQHQRRRQAAAVAGGYSATTIPPRRRRRPSQHPTPPRARPAPALAPLTSDSAEGERSPRSSNKSPRSSETSPRSGGGKVSELKASLAINPAMMLPGAAPPRKPSKETFAPSEEGEGAGGPSAARGAGDSLLHAQLNRPTRTANRRGSRGRSAAGCCPRRPRPRLRPRPRRRPRQRPNQRASGAGARARACGQQRR